MFRRVLALYVRRLLKDIVPRILVPVPLVILVLFSRCPGVMPGTYCGGAVRPGLQFPVKEISDFTIHLSKQA